MSNILRIGSPWGGGGEINWDDIKPISIDFELKNNLQYNLPAYYDQRNCYYNLYSNYEDDGYTYILKYDINDEKLSVLTFKVETQKYRYAFNASPLLYRSDYNFWMFSLYMNFDGYSTYAFSLPDLEDATKNYRDPTTLGGLTNLEYYNGSGCRWVNFTGSGTTYLQSCGAWKTKYNSAFNTSVGKSSITVNPSYQTAGFSRVMTLPVSIGGPGSLFLFTDRAVYYRFSSTKAGNVPTAFTDTNIKQHFNYFNNNYYFYSIGSNRWIKSDLGNRDDNTISTTSFHQRPTTNTAEYMFIDRDAGFFLIWNMETKKFYGGYDIDDLVELGSSKLISEPIYALSFCHNGMFRLLNLKDNKYYYISTDKLINIYNNKKI